MQSGIPPNVLVDHDFDMLAALQDELIEKDQRDSWRVTEELLAQILEMLSIMRGEAWALQGVKRWPDPISVPRPSHLERSPSETPRTNSGVRAVTPREYARSMALGA